MEGFSHGRWLLGPIHGCYSRPHDFHVLSKCSHVLLQPLPSPVSSPLPAGIGPSSQTRLCVLNVAIAEASRKRLLPEASFALALSK